MTKKEMKTFTLDEESLQVLQIGKERGLNKSLLIRMALEEFSKKHMPDVHKDIYRKRKNPLSK